MANGWQRIDSWVDDPCTMGDDCASDVHVSLYARRSSDGRGEERFQVAYYVEATMTYNQPEVAPTFVTSEQNQWWRVKRNEHGEDYGADSAEITYEDASPSVFFFETAEAAERECIAAAAEDESYKLGW